MFANIVKCLKKFENVLKSLKKFLKSVSSVSDTVPPGCLHEDGFLENPRRLLKQTPGKYKL